jgi:hypothetical protein
MRNQKANDYSCGPALRTNDELLSLNIGAYVRAGAAQLLLRCLGIHFGMVGKPIPILISNKNGLQSMLFGYVGRLRSATQLCARAARSAVEGFLELGKSEVVTRRTANPIHFQPARFVLFCGWSGLAVLRQPCLLFPEGRPALQQFLATPTTRAREPLKP